MRKHLSIFAFLLCAFCGLAQEADHYYVAANVSCTMIRSGTQDPLSFSTYSVTAQGYYSTKYTDSGNPYTSLMLNGNTLTAQAPEGYRFLGWYTKSSGWLPGQYETDPPPATVESATDLLSTSPTLTDDVAKRAGTRRGIPIVFAKFIPVYAITVGVEPEAAGRATRSPAQDLYDKGTEVGLTAVVTNAAYKLAYWKKGNNKVSGSDGKLSLQITATADAAYTAYFTNKTYTVTFHDPSATFSDNVQTVTHGQSATAPAWSRTGYSLTWDKSFSNITADTTVNAQWTARQYAVTFHDPSGAHADVVRTVSYGQSASAPSWSRTGYKSPTWDKSFSSVTANMTVNAQWTPETYTITYSGLKQGATNPNNPTTYTIETATITFQPPTAVVRYKFNGWTPLSIPKGSTGNKTVAASYLETVDKPIVTPTLTYNGSQQACATTDSRIQASNNKKTVPGKYTATFEPKSGYCWSDGTVSKVSANWEIVNATITDARVVQSGSLTYTGEQQQAKVSTQATVKGSQTTTWKYSKSDGSYAAAMPSFIDAGTHKVYFEVSAQYHNPAYGSFDVVINRAKTAKVELSKTSFSYTGLEQGPDVTFTHCTEASGSVKRGTNVGTYKIKATPDANYAWSDERTGTREFEWKIEEGHFTATVSAGEGGRGGSTFSYWTKQEAQTEHIYPPTRTGYQISEWTASGYVGEAPTVSGDYVTIPARTAGNFTLTPTWTPITYTIAFDGNGGAGSMSSVQLAYDEPYEVPSCEFTKTGCEFQRWQVLIDNRAVTNYTAGVVVSNLTSVANKIVTFKAEWTSYYTIAFDGNGATNTVMATQLVERDVTTNLAANAYVRPGYGFLGWDDIQNKRRYGDGAAVRNIAEVGATNTLKAAWSTNTYSVAFFGNGGTNTMEAQDFVYDELQKLRQNAFIRTGYDFAGWALDPADDVRYGDQDEVVNLTDEDRVTVALYARWTPAGGLDNIYSVAADCATNLADRTALDLRTGDEEGCSVVLGPDAGGNGRFVRLMPPESAQVKLSAEFKEKGVLAFSYKVINKNYNPEWGADNNVFKAQVETPLATTKVLREVYTNVVDWTTVECPIEDGDTVAWYYVEGEGTSGDYALIDNIRWIPDEHDAGTVGVTFRLEDGSVFSNLTCVAEAAIGELPTPIDDAGRTFLGWTYQGSVIDADWKVPADDDGVNLIAKWDSGEHPVPVDGKDNVTISSAAVADGKFSLSFESNEDFDYNLLTNANLLIDSWGVMATEKGTGGDITFEPQIIEGQPQLFYKVETIQKK